MGWLILTFGMAILILCFLIGHSLEGRFSHLGAPCVPPPPLDTVKENDSTMHTPVREDLVESFHEAFGHPIRKPIDEDTVKLLMLRRKLLLEEFKEVDEAIDFCHVDIMNNGAATEESIMHLLKELTDLQYVLSGFAVTFGLDLQTSFERVHTSNMSKFHTCPTCGGGGGDGNMTCGVCKGAGQVVVYREDGKVLKGPDYKEPDLTGLV